MAGRVGRLLAKSISGTMSAAAENHDRYLRSLSFSVCRPPGAGCGRGHATTAVPSLLLRAQRHPLAVPSLGHLRPSPAVASLLGSETAPFSRSDEERAFLDDKADEPVTVRRRRSRQETGEAGYLVLNNGRRIGRQAETMPMLHSTSIHTPTLMEVHVMSESLSSARRGMRTMPAIQTLISTVRGCTAPQKDRSGH